jgi:hypothetical protein
MVDIAQLQEFLAEAKVKMDFMPFVEQAQKP